MKSKRHILSVILAIALLLIPTAVFAKELGLLTITGPGIKGELSLNSPDEMNKIMGAGFFDQTNTLSKAPENLGQGYNITAHLNLDGKMTPFISLVYYPVEQGQPGYINYTGRLDGTTLRTVNEWGKLSLSADNAFRTLMTDNNITLQPAVIVAAEVPAKVAEPAEASSVVSKSEPVNTNPVPATPVQVPYLILALVSGILLLAGTGLIIRRRVINQRSV